MMKKIYYEKTYEGYPIKCEANYPCYRDILAKLMKVIQTGKNRFTRPIGFHIRYRARDSVDGRVITDRLNKCYRNKNSGRKKEHTFSPCWLKVTELDPEKDGTHNHLALVIEGKYATHRSLQYLFADLHEKGLLENYCIVEAREALYSSGVDLKSETGVVYYMNWLSYLAKTRTKEFIKQTHSTSRL